MFTKIFIENPYTFNELSQSTQFEEMNKHIKISNLVNSNNPVPIIRTTTKYNNPHQIFPQIYNEIVQNIINNSNIDELEFNNAMVEIYDEHYRKMGFHTDQTLDLKEDTYIALYSCYEDPETTEFRSLIVKNKETNEEEEIILEHNSVVMFSYLTNCSHVHKIVFKGKHVCNWMGMTLRTSKTYVKHMKDITYFYDTGDQLTLADENECKNFYKLKSIENNKKTKVNYENHPKVTYTISKSDMLKVLI
jgi:hypothetical protein